MPQTYGVKFGRRSLTFLTKCRHCCPSKGRVKLMNKNSRNYQHRSILHEVSACLIKELFNVLFRRRVQYEMLNQRVALKTRCAHKTKHLEQVEISVSCYGSYISISNNLSDSLGRTFIVYLLTRSMVAVFLSMDFIYMNNNKQYIQYAPRCILVAKKQYTSLIKLKPILY